MAGYQGGAPPATQKNNTPSGYLLQPAEGNERNESTTVFVDDFSGDFNSNTYIDIQPTETVIGVFDGLRFRHDKDTSNQPLDPNMFVEVHFKDGESRRAYFGEKQGLRTDSATFPIYDGEVDFYRFNWRQGSSNDTWTVYWFELHSPSVRPHTHTL